jgi:hypothetical protein
MHRGCFTFIAVFAVGSLAACKPPAPPKSDELKAQFSVDLPSYWRTHSFALDAEQAPASPADPYRARFRAEVELLTPMYVEDQRFGDTVIIRMTGKAGDRKTVFGRVEAHRKNRRWNPSLRLENGVAEQPGRPREFFQARRLIIAGTPEERRFWDERQAAEAKAREEARQFQREMALNALAGEWQGEVFGTRDSRLYVVRQGEALTATLFHQRHREELFVEELPDGRVRLTGFAVVRQDGREARNYNLDILDLQLSADGTLLHGTALDQGGQSGTVRLSKIGG